MTAKGSSAEFHRIVVDRDRDGDVVDIRFECTAPADASCRHFPACSCEEWDEELHPVGGPPAPGHEDVPQDECWMIPWLTATLDPYDVIDIGSEADGTELVESRLRTGGITCEWEGDYLTWAYADEPGAVGVRLDGGKLHVFRPGIRPITRCGIRAGRRNDVDDDVLVATVEPANRCANCFAGSGSRG